MRTSQVVLIFYLVIIAVLAIFLGKYVEPTQVRPERLNAEELIIVPNPVGPGEKVHVSVKLIDEARYVSLRYGEERKVSLKNGGKDVWTGEFAAPGESGRYELALLVTDYGERDYVVKRTEWFLDVR